MLRKLLLPGEARFARCGPPAFLLQLDELDRKAYRRSIDRWEAEGGATVGVPGAGSTPRAKSALRTSCE